MNAPLPFRHLAGQGSTSTLSSLKGAIQVQDLTENLYHMYNCDHFTNSTIFRCFGVMMMIDEHDPLEWNDGG